MMIILAIFLLLHLAFVLYACCVASSSSERVIEAFHIWESELKREVEGTQARE